MRTHPATLPGRSARFPALALALMMGVFCAQDAAAQVRQIINPAFRDPFREFERSDSVTDRPRPDYEPPGIRQGSFFIYPALTLAYEYDDNILATENGEIADSYVAADHTVRVESDWGRHMLEFGGTGVAGKYFDIESEDFEEYGFDVEGRYDISGASAVRAEASFAHLDEERSSINDPDGVAPIEFDRINAALGFRQRFNRMRIDVEARFLRFDFDDGTLPNGLATNQDDRDRDQYLLAATARYNIRPDYDVFLHGEYDVRLYDQPQDDNGIDRDSRGYTVRAGGSMDLTGLIFAEASIGYFEQDYEDSGIRKVDGLDVELAGYWNVTRLTTITVETRRFARETVVPGVSGVNSTDLGVRVDHELRRNLLLRARANYLENDFEGIVREDDNFLYELGARYLWNRNLEFDAQYRWQQRDSDIPGQDFTKNTILLRLTAGL